jgi:DNA-binding SARP family transcriptional activator/ABC-type transport system substrate-binding protein
MVEVGPKGWETPVFMEFRILGPLEVEEDGRPIALGGDKQRSLLALLLLGRGHPVSTERLIEEIWHGEPPATATKSIQVYAARLRSLLGSERIVKRRRGYELVVAPGEVDADRFERLVVAASGAPPAEAAAHLKEALALWRGHPLADLSLEPWAEAETARLEERRLTAFEDWADAELALGNHRELVPELEALVAEHPFREQLLERLVLALYRSGRQAEALSAYRRGAARLRTELGLEPSQSLRELEARVLQQHESLAAPRLPKATAARRRRSWRLVVAGAGVVVAAAAAAAVVESTRGAGASLESIPPGVAIIDVSRHHPRLIAHIPASEIGAPAEATKGDGSFWVWRLKPFSMLQIDPRNGHEGTSVASPRGDIGGFLIDGKTLWFSGSRLERMDIASGRELGAKQLSRIRYDDVGGIARGAGSLWVARAVEGDVLRLDPVTGAIRDHISVPGEKGALVYAPDGVWVATSDGVKHIDPATDEITATAAVPGDSLDLAYGGGYIWASNETEGTVSKIAESGQIVHTYDTGQGAYRMSYADGTLWVANQDDGTVTGIDAATGHETTIPFGHLLQTVAALPGRLLVMVNPGRTYDDRINALRGKVARLIVPGGLDDPDPAVGPPPNPFIFQVEHATCAPLLGYPDVAAPAGQRLVPEVAAAWPSLSRDRRTYTFVVRKGFRFAPPSGASLDAETFRFSIERALNPKLGPRALGYPYLADVVGATGFHAGRAVHVRGITVRGNRISFTLLKPSPDFLERLALPYFCPVPQSTTIEDGGVQGTPPPGAGPYTVKDAYNGEYLILVRNPYYGGRRPQGLDAIAFREGIATDKAIQRVVAGDWDVLEDIDPQVSPGGIVAHRFTSAANTTGVSYRAFAGSLTLYLALDARWPPFSNPAFRRKLAAGIERRALAAAVDAEPTSHLLPPGVRGGGPTAVTSTQSWRPFGKVSVRFGVQAGDELGRTVADEVRDELASLGIDVRAVVVSNLEAAMRDPSTRIGVVALQTQILSPDPGSFLMQMLGRDVPPSWLPPATRTAVARLHALTGKARDDAAQRLASQLVTHDVPVIPFGVPTVGTLTGRRLGCRIWNGVDQGFDLALLCLRNS